MTSYDKDQGRAQIAAPSLGVAAGSPREGIRLRFFGAALALVLAFGGSVSLGATPARADSGDEMTSEHRPRPPAYVPAPRPYHRPYYRPAPRRVYVAPTYYPRPRRAVESVYNPMFHFGIGIHGNTVLDAEGSPITSGLGTGVGFDLSFGWRIASTFSLDFNWMTSFHDADEMAAGDEAALSHFSLDGRFFLTDRSRQVQPYLQAGIGAYILGRDSWDYDTLTGVGFQLGGGVDIYLSRHVSIGGKLLYRGAHLDNSDVAWPSFPTESTWLSTLAYGGDLKFHF